jgi:predicted RNA-binding Zn ribbon-like protein
MVRNLSTRPEFAFELTGGELCLDFANTVDHRRGAERKADNLKTYDALLSFAAQTGIVSMPSRAQLAKAAARNLAEARRILRAVVELREAIYRIFSALAAAETPKSDDLRLLNRHAQSALRHMQLRAQDGGFGWDWPQASALEAPLWRIAKSAADLLTSAEAHAVRECAADTCGWLFVDRSRNHARRWCDMKICGNREKARRHYSRAQRRRARRR